MSKRMIDSELIDSLIKGGLKPIHTYDVADGTRFDVLFEILSPDGWYSGFGYILNGEDASIYPGIFNYNVVDGKIVSFSGMDNSSKYSWSEGEGLNINSISTTDISQNKLYMHQITLSNAEGQSKRFQYITSYQVVANSIDNLTRLLSGRDVYLDTVQILHKTGNDWRIVGSNENFVVSAVSDVMTPLEN